MICFCICERTYDVIPNTLFPFLIITQHSVPNALYRSKVGLISISDFVITFLLNRKELPEIRTYHCQKNNKTILNLLPYRKTLLKSLHWIWSIKHTYSKLKYVCRNPSNTLNIRKSMIEGCFPYLWQTNIRISSLYEIDLSEHSTWYAKWRYWKLITHK